MGAMGIGHPIWNLTDSYFAFRQLSAFHIFLPPKTQKGRGLLGTMPNFLKIALKLSAKFLMFHPD
jgi:hypothetical protein